MADIEFVEGDFGDNYDISIYKTDGTTADITGYTTATLKIKTLDLVTTKLTKTLTIVTPTPALVRWVMASGDTNYNTLTDSLTAQIELSAAGLDKRTYELSVYVARKV